MEEAQYSYTKIIILNKNLGRVYSSISRKQDYLYNIHKIERVVSNA